MMHHNNHHHQQQQHHHHNNLTLSFSNLMPTVDHHKGNAISLQTLAPANTNYKLAKF